jgi:peptide/nickel transport system substrate-binding protein
MKGEVAMGRRDMMRSTWALLMAFALLASMVLGTENAVAGPGERGTLRFGNTVPVPAIDPHIVTDEAGMMAALLLYDPLLYPRPGSMEPGPHLAESWEVSPDGTIYRFRLRSGIRFQNGETMTAADVVFSMDRILSLRRGWAGLWLPILEVGRTRAIDDRTVEFHLREPYAPFLASMLLFFVVNRNQVMANLAPGEFGAMGDYGMAFLRDRTAGSGPYTLERWERGGDFVANRFTGYWRGWRTGQVERVVYRTVPEEATLRGLFRRGDLDMTSQWLSIEGFRELARIDGVVVQEDPAAQLFHVAMHTQRAPTNDLNLRKALAHVFDYRATNTFIMPGARPAQGPVPLLTHGHNREVEAYTRDVRRARGYLAESGYRRGTPIDLYWVVEVPMQERIALLLQSRAAEIGITINVVAIPWVRLTELTRSRETTPHMAFFFDTLKYPHQDSHTFAMYHRSAWGSWRGMSWYDNAEVHRLLERARREVDPQRSMALYKDAQARITADYPSIFINNPVHRVAIWRHVQGYHFSGLMGFDLNFYHLRLVR